MTLNAWSSNEKLPLIFVFMATKCNSGAAAGNRSQCLTQHQAATTVGYYALSYFSTQKSIAAV